MGAPTVLHYLRCSSLPQADGDSLRRQRLQAQQYCAAHGFVVSREVVDEGVSAFRGKNLVTFEKLVAEVKAGSLPRGTLLLVESLDRFSRDSLFTSLFALLALVRGGVNVVDLSKNLSFDADSFDDLGTLLTGSLELKRAHEESVRKSGFVRDARSAARAQRNRAQFAWPGWLRKNSDTFEPVPELAASVVRVFESVAAGSGAKATAVRANEEGWPVPSKRPAAGWHHSFVSRLVRSQSVLGRYEFHVLEHGRRVPTGDVVEDWYPAVVSLDLFYRANESMNSRQFARGRHSYENLNPFRGLLRCGMCGESYSLHPGQYPSYFCRGRARGVCDSPAVAHRLLLSAVIPPLIQSWSEQFDSAGLKSKHERELIRLDAELAEIARCVAVTQQALYAVGADVPFFALELRDLTAKQQQLTMARSGVVATLAALPEAFYLDVGQVLRAYLVDRDDTVRKEFALRARQLVERALVYPGAAVAVVVRELSAPLVVPLADARDRFDAARYWSLLSQPLPFADANSSQK